MDLRFNIIFVPKTVQYLTLAVLSLLRNSSYCYRLVSNGLDTSENRLLEEFCQKHDRLEYFYYPVNGILDHGTMLNLLFEREDSPYFCFADSDIFAVGRFEEDLEKQLQQCDVLSSCLPLGMGPEDVFTGFSGRCLKTPNGLPLAPTFFSIYRKEKFKRIISETKIGFEIYHPTRFLPEVVKNMGLSHHLQGIRRIDTGKLLNIVAVRYNIRFLHHEFANLVHIGGISSKKGSLRKRIDEVVRNLLGFPFKLTDGYIEAEVDRRQKVSLPDPYQRGLNTSLDNKRIRSRALRNPLALYFTHFFRSLFDGAKPPVLGIHDDALRYSIEKVTRIIHDLYLEEYK